MTYEVLFRAVCIIAFWAALDLLLWWMGRAKRNAWKDLPDELEPRVDSESDNDV
jgi:hypothetical protein